MPYSTSSLLFVIGLGLTLPAKAQSAPDLDPGCVAYQAEKRVMFVTEMTVVGKSCQANGELEFSQQGYQVRVQIPVESFDSGEARRDHDVKDRLTDALHPNIEVRSDFFTVDEWRKWEEQGAGRIMATLQVRGEKARVELPFQIQDGHVHGVLKTRFSELGLQAPSVVGGVVAKVRDDLKLFFNLAPDSVQGFEQSELSE